MFGAMAVFNVGLNSHVNHGAGNIVPWWWQSREPLPLTTRCVSRAFEWFGLFAHGYLWDLLKFLHIFMIFKPHKSFWLLASWTRGADLIWFLPTADSCGRHHYQILLPNTQFAEIPLPAVNRAWQCKENSLDSSCCHKYGRPRSKLVTNQFSYTSFPNLIQCNLV